jgi:catechol 2,3-dioxygenase-like lactoylglutathione lyase family enzyme
VIDHITIEVSDLEKSKTFYEKAFKPLGYKVAFGEKGKFWAFDVGVGLFEIMPAKTKLPLTNIHVAFRAKTKSEIVKFYEAAIEAGAKDNGAPGPRPAYTQNYYASFVLDPDGHNIEAMLDEPLQ